MAAEKLGWNYLDSGSLYRLTALAAKNQGISWEDEVLIEKVALELDVKFTKDSVLLSGKDVSREIRSEEISAGASIVSKLPAVRKALLGRMRAFSKPPGLVTDGRDMGTVVFPEAQIKIFLTASSEERAKRRHNQLVEKGESAIYEDILAAIIERDERDSNRSIAPLRPHPDAHIIDATELSIEEVLETVLRLVGK